MTRTTTRAITALVVLIMVALVGAAAWYGVRVWRIRHAAPTSASTESMATAPTAAPAAIPRGEVTIDPRRQQLMGLRTVRVAQAAFDQDVRTVGIVKFDESRQTDVNLQIEGWIRDLYVDTTGQAITQGQPLFALYSPDVRTTAREYVLGLQARDDLQDSTILEARTRAEALVNAARARLKLWQVPDDVMRAIDQTRVVPETIPFRSPVTGIVTEKTAVQGMHVSPGQSLFKVANLTTVWVEADLRENEIAGARVGAAARISLDSYPGREFRGRIVYVYPYLDEATRTNKVRIELPNPGGLLRPGMFANVELTSHAAPGLSVPADAVLDSGSEQIVFVARGAGRFQPTPVRIGRRSADSVEVLSGVRDGEEVVASAAFLLDSESQLRASLRAFEPIEPAQPNAHTTPAETMPALTITLRTTPSPPRTGENQFEVIVHDARGAAIADADVSVELFMPAMPSMSMPAMRHDVKLAPAGDGVYRGTGQLMTAGRWDATITVSRGGRRLGSLELPVIAR